jgi:hypothetical protein
MTFDWLHENTIKTPQHSEQLLTISYVRQIIRLHIFDLMRIHSNLSANLLKRNGEKAIDLFQFLSGPTYRDVSTQVFNCLPDMLHYRGPSHALHRPLLHQSERIDDRKVNEMTGRMVPRTSCNRALVRRSKKRHAAVARD